MFNNDNRNIGKLFNDVLEDFDENLPNRVWDNVKNELKREKSRKKTLVYLSIAASVALIIAFSSGYFIALNNSKKQQFSNSDIHKELNNKPLAIKEDTKTKLKNNDTTKINALLNNVSNIHKINNLQPLKPQMNSSLALQQNSNNQKKDSNNIINDSISNNKQNLTAKNDIKNLASDTANTPKPKPDIRKDFLKDINNQADINRNQNTVKNNSPEETPKKQENYSGKWSLAEQFSPVGYWGGTQKAVMADMVSNGYSNSNQSNSEKYNDKKLLLVYATGINFKYQYSRKWGVKSGIYYAIGELYPGYLHKQIEVPIMTNYTLVNKKFNWEIDGGLGVNLSFFQILKKVNYSGLIGTVLSYNISRRIAVGIEPTIKYTYSAMRISFPYPFSLAVYTGLSYKF